MATKFSISTIYNLKERKVFFDANVLIYLFWPTGSTQWENKYSTIFNNLLKQKNVLVVDFIVISEVINRAHRIVFSQVSKFESYKVFRNSDLGIETLKDIYLIIEDNILKNFLVIGKAFNKKELQSFLHVDTLDFGDKGILLICQENNFVLLTNDIDFKTSNIDIISANPAVLNHI